MISFAGRTSPEGRAAPVRTRTFTFATTTSSVPSTRQRAHSELVRCGLDARHPVLTTALVILSELVTNSVLHAASHSSHFSVTITSRAQELVLSVHDRHPYIPGPRPEPVEHDECNGRGLNLVAVLSAEVGGRAETVPDEDCGGKTIRVSIPLPAEAHVPAI